MIQEMIDRQKYLTSRKKGSKYMGFQQDDDRQNTVVDKWDLHNGEYSTLPVSCEFNVGTPSLALALQDFSFPWLKMKSLCLALCELRFSFFLSFCFFLSFFFKDQTKHRSHNNSARCKRPATFAYCSTGAAADILAMASMFCPKICLATSRDIRRTSFLDY